jgi:pyruvate/2-oxoglutarate dehydrogenase complex dihydrolipoamide dehydrogenase (E3) component
MPYTGPYVINVIPAVASVGEMPQSSSDVLIFTFSFQCNRRAIIEDQTWGFVKLWTTRNEPKRIIAVQLVHEAASELIEYYNIIMALSELHTVSDSFSNRVVIIRDIPLTEVCLLSFAHPTYAESVKQTCEYVLGQSMTYEGTYLN